ncbi:30S ribosomal protein S15 [Candidatus Gugararchaeum adminiculabundum]|nr:30S ribosomal protein S15 [Candidatus Gugararchaeum adminiculabundum]
MARMHSKKRGKSGSKKPTTREVPDWVEFAPADVEKMVVDLGNKGMSSATIGMILRDEHGIPSVKNICKKGVTKVLTTGGVKIEYPEDLMSLIKKAVGMRKHITKNNKDASNKTKLVHVESKIRRLVLYYTRVGRLPADWKYNPEQAALIVK